MSYTLAKKRASSIKPERTRGRKTPTSVFIYPSLHNGQSLFRGSVFAQNSPIPYRSRDDSHSLSKKHQEQLNDPLSKERRELDRFLDKFAHGDTQTTVQTATKWIDKVRKCFIAQSILVPNAGFGDENEVLLVWSRDRHCLELEVEANGNASFFYRDRETGKNWMSDDLKPDQELPSETIQKLSFFETSKKTSSNLISR